MDHSPNKKEIESTQRQNDWFCIAMEIKKKGAAVLRPYKRIRPRLQLI
jgi:hypothetical protein